MSTCGVFSPFAFSWFGQAAGRFFSHQMDTGKSSDAMDRAMSSRTPSAAATPVAPVRQVPPSSAPSTLSGTVLPPSVASLGQAFANETGISLCPPDVNTTKRPQPLQEKSYCDVMGAAKFDGNSGKWRQCAGFPRAEKPESVDQVFAATKADAP